MVPSSSPVPFWIARLMLSAGMFDCLALSTAVRRRGLRVGVAAADARGDRHLADDLGEQLAALGVGRALLVLDRVPLGMSGHARLLATRGRSLARAAAAGWDRMKAPPCSIAT